MRKSADPQALDEATRVLYAKIRGMPRNRRLASALEQGQLPSAVRAPGVRIVLVPGILYRDYPQTGADGARLRVIAESFGIPVETIPADGTTGLDAAATLIIDRLDRLPANDRVLLFSLSKGSAEVRHALTQARADAAFRRVHAWVSVSGLPFGTPSFEGVLSRPLSRILFAGWFWWRRWKLEPVRELLAYQPRAPFALPSHLEFIQIAAFPLRSHLRDRRSKRLQRRIEMLGPNDGFAVLNDLAALPGTLYPVWGADHYLEGAPDLTGCIARLIVYLIGRLEGSVGLEDGMPRWCHEDPARSSSIPAELGNRDVPHAPGSAGPT
jgi:hypothetical protein